MGVGTAHLTRLNKKKAMMNNTFPNLLILSKLIEPIDLSLKKILASKDRLKSDTDEIFVHGVFVMSVSFMEVMISDVLKYYLMNFPQNLSKSEFQYNKDIFLENRFNLLEKTVECHVLKLSYSSLENIFCKLMEYLSLEWEDFHDSYAKYLQEIKATRNLLLHNNLKINDIYNESAGSAKRDRVEVDYKYAVNSIDKIISFANELKKRISNKYQNYTKIKANKRLWYYIFKSPVMPYDDFWQYDESKDHIYALKRDKDEDGLSGSEHMLLTLWRSHFNHSKIKEFNMKFLDGNNQKKVLYFLSIAKDFSFE